MKIYVAAPANTATGGPELLHQLCYTLRQNGFDAIMYYYHEKENLPPVNSEYTEYHNPYVLEHEEIEVSDEDVFVIPETNTQLFRKMKKPKRIFWWLSVDNFYNSMKPWKLARLQSISHKLKLFPLEKLFKESVSFCVNKRAKKVIPQFTDRKVIHLVQSYYAFNHCLSLGISNNQILYLSDYLNPLFIQEAKRGKEHKENIILYNPKKGAEFTRKLIKSSNFHYVALRGFTRKQMIELLKKAKLYIDFGNHPGKDRIPREAAICGCCIITDKKGSASFYRDVPIPDDYKFEDEPENIPIILEKIQDILSNYEQKTKDFDEYRNMIIGEEQQFKEDTVKVFNKIVKKNI